MKDIIFLGMDICKEMGKITSQLLCKNECDGMNDDQLAAYKMGIKNALSLLHSTIETDNNHAVINIIGLNDVEEFYIEDLMKELFE